MTNKEIGELRRRMKPDRTNLTAVYGCYVASSGDELKDVLESCGVSEDKRMQFGAQFDESFGGGAVLNPRNLIDVKKCVVKTPDVSITVNPERPDLIETRTLGGVRYILIKADEGVELNGIDLAEEAE